MDFNKDKIDNYQDSVNKKEKFIRSENINYLYPNGHRSTNQMRWFKGVRDIELKSDMAA
tara:strand:+ start:417 stop:593 length:177 start_codon:yes stop_codon:yes gene_type:complete